MVQGPIGSHRAVVAALDECFARGLITAVLDVVKSGKEATVYRCQAGPAAGPGVTLLAAKVYRSLARRDFRNDAAYQVGRAVGDRKRRDRLAFQQRSRHGRDVQFDSWIASEFQVLHRLYGAGVDLPRPILRCETAILMEYVGDATGAAPLLSQVSLSPDEAAAAFERLMANVARCLAHHCVHADLSPFNVLYWQGIPRLIDFPQAVDPRFNRNAEHLLQRDVANLCRYFVRQGLAVDPLPLAGDLWQRYLRGELA
jgi:RIO kinase 1